jgi:hypothetical protein
MEETTEKEATDEVLSESDESFEDEAREIRINFWKQAYLNRKQPEETCEDQTGTMKTDIQ